MRVYDPLSLSYAFSLLGYSGTNGGSGSTQAARWDNAAKYVYQLGPFNAGVMYSNGGIGHRHVRQRLRLQHRRAFGGFSREGVYTKEHGAVNLQTSVNDVFGGQTLAANMSDNTAWWIMGKYTLEFGGHPRGSVSDQGSKGRSPRATS